MSEVNPTSGLVFGEEEQFEELTPDQRRDILVAGLIHEMRDCTDSEERKAIYDQIILINRGEEPTPSQQQVALSMHREHEDNDSDSNS